mmetsp:Transcript_13965/g.37482  ORF Transcript_13965/g.37482 Transcript_13965/m.37482 type:complete len:751 (-) Transcript_13965:305-2557(-)
MFDGHAFVGSQSCAKSGAVGRAQVKFRVHVCTTCRADEASVRSRRGSVAFGNVRNVRNVRSERRTASPSDAGRVVMLISGGNGGGGDSHGGGGTGGFDGDRLRDDGGELNEFPPRILIAFASWLGSGADTFIEKLKEVPGPFIALVTAVLTTFLNQRFKVKESKVNEQKKAEEDAVADEQKRLSELADDYATYALPLLKAATYLQLELFKIGTADFEGCSGVVQDAKPSPKVEPESKQTSSPEPPLAILHCTYLIARLLGYIEVIRHERPLFDFGRKTRDRFFSNALGRIGFVLDAPETELRPLHQLHTQNSEIPLSEDALQIPTYTQTALGELMRSKRWIDAESFGRTSHLGQIASGVVGSGDAIIAFPDFMELYRHNNEFRAWFEPVAQSVNRVVNLYRRPGSALQVDEEAGSSSNPLAVRCHRLELLQCAVVDLMDFLDPPPAFNIIPAYYRVKRLIAPSSLDVSDIPSPIRQLFGGLNQAPRSASRPKDSFGEKHSKIVTEERTVYVFVKASSDPDSSRVGDDPYSHRVVLGLEQMGIPYRLFPVDVDPIFKPLWFVNVHPKGTCPVVLHDGRLVDESELILQYLHDAFPDKRLAPSPKLARRKLRPATSEAMASWMKWLQISERSGKATDALERQVVQNLLAVDKVIGEYSKPWLGGDMPCSLDIMLIPFVYHFNVVSAKLKAVPSLSNEGAPKLDALQKYFDRVTELPAFINSRASVEEIVHGYRRLMAGENDCASQRITFSRF